MSNKTSAIRVRNANAVAASLCEALASLVERGLKKKLQDSERILQLNFAKFSFA
jgi:hypothetical protein